MNQTCVRTKFGNSAHLAAEIWVILWVYVYPLFFFDLILNVPVNNFSVMLGTEPPIPGYYQYFGE